MATREKMPLSEQGMAQPYTSPYTGQQPQQPYPGQQYPGQQYPGQQYSGGQPIQTVYIQSMPTQSRSYDNYNGKLSVIFGASLIVMTTVAICLNVAGVIVQRGREYDWIGNLMFFVFPSAWSGIFVSI